MSQLSRSLTLPFTRSLYSLLPALSLFLCNLLPRQIGMGRWMLNVLFFSVFPISGLLCSRSSPPFIAAVEWIFSHAPYMKGRAMCQDGSQLALTQGRQILTRCRVLWRHTATQTFDVGVRCTSRRRQNYSRKFHFAVGKVSIRNDTKRLNVTRPTQLLCPHVLIWPFLRDPKEMFNSYPWAWRSKKTRRGWCSEGRTEEAAWSSYSNLWSFVTICLLKHLYKGRL